MATTTTTTRPQQQTTFLSLPPELRLHIYALSLFPVPHHLGPSYKPTVIIYSIDLSTASIGRLNPLAVRPRTAKAIHHPPFRPATPGLLLVNRVVAAEVLWWMYEEGVGGIVDFVGGRGLKVGAGVGLEGIDDDDDENDDGGRGGNGSGSGAAAAALLSGDGNGEGGNRGNADGGGIGSSGAAPTIVAPPTRRRVLGSGCYRTPGTCCGGRGDGGRGPVGVWDGAGETAQTAPVPVPAPAPALSRAPAPAGPCPRRLFPEDYRNPTNSKPWVVLPRVLCRMKRLEIRIPRSIIRGKGEWGGAKEFGKWGAMVCEVLRVVGDDEDDGGEGGGSWGYGDESREKEKEKTLKLVVFDDCGDEEVNIFVKEMEGRRITMLKGLVEGVKEVRKVEIVGDGSVFGEGVVQRGNRRWRGGIEDEILDSWEDGDRREESEGRRAGHWKILSKQKRANGRTR